MGLLFVVCGLIACCGGCANPTAPSSSVAHVLLRDDFNGTALDSQTWEIPAGVGTFLGRTQLRPPSESIRVADGVLRLRIDSYNPTAIKPGDSFWGSEIVSRQMFARGTGLVFLARVRLVDPVPGMVASLFAYRSGMGTRDEIDFEMLTNDVAFNRVLTNLFRNEGFTSAGDPRNVIAPGFLATDFNELEFEWRPEVVRWKINGRVVREESMNIPGDPMTLRLNFWVPSTDFASAYDARLHPESTPIENHSFFYEVDSVEVRALPMNIRSLTAH